MWFLLAMTASLLWGLNYVLAEKAMQYVSPFTLMALEVLAAGVVVLIVSVARGSLMRDLHVIATNDRAAILTVASIVAFTVADTAIFLSIAAKNATVSSLVEISYPVFIVAFTWLLFRESHLTPSVVTGALLIFSGVTLIMVRG
jgi:drug/metabolite transporter (DMT)-like permease